MRLKWLKLVAIVALTGTSAHAEWKITDGGYGPIQATSDSVEDWREIMVSALWVDTEFSGGLSWWNILYLHADGSIWDCRVKRFDFKSMSCSVKR